MRRTILTETHNPIRLACTLCGILLWQAAQAHAPVPFGAVYEVRVDGKPRLEARITLVREGDAWKLSSTSSATSGLARLLRVSTEEHSTGRWRDGRLEPLEYRHHTKVAGRDDRWSASFDWAKQVVTTSTEDGDFELPLGEDTTDPLSVTLVLGRHPASGAPEFTIGVLDEDEIDEHLYRASPPGPLQTELGCLEVVALELPVALPVPLLVLLATLEEEDEDESTGAAPSARRYQFSTGSPRHSPTVTMR